MGQLCPRANSGSRRVDGGAQGQCVPVDIFKHQFSVPVWNLLFWSLHLRLPLKNKLRGRNG